MPRRTELVGDGPMRIQVHHHEPTGGWTTPPSGVVLLLSGPITTGTSWFLDVDGYDAGVRLAANGRAAVSVDYLGTGGSAAPDHGRSITPLDSIESLRSVLPRLIDRYGVERIDLVGESVGGAIATQLAADPSAVRSVVLTTVMYRSVSAAAAAQFTSEGFAAWLDAVPDGYLDVDAGFLGGALADAEPAAAAAMIETQAGPYPAGFLGLPLQGLPYFDPGVARAPGLVLVGPHDPVPADGDADALAADYGPSGAWSEVIDGGGHVLRLQASSIADRFWTRIGEWLDDPHHPS